LYEWLRHLGGKAKMSGLFERVVAETGAVRRTHISLGAAA
jgi:hypothetical protein